MAAASAAAPTEGDTDMTGPDPSDRDEGGHDGAAGSDAATTEGETRFEVKKWMPIAMWSWNIKQDNCAICRNSLYEPSIEHQALGNPEVTIAWGACNHCFHLECIQRWLKTRNVCPLCTREWEFQKIQKVV